MKVKQNPDKEYVKSIREQLKATTVIALAYLKRHQTLSVCAKNSEI